MIAASTGKVNTYESKNDSAVTVPAHINHRRADAERDALAKLPSTCRRRFRGPRFQIRERRDAARIEAALPHDRRVEAGSFRSGSQLHAGSAMHGGCR